MGVQYGCDTEYDGRRGPEDLDAGSLSVEVADGRSFKCADYGGHMPRCSHWHYCWMRQ
jgi:hypothetical protein